MIEQPSEPIDHILVQKIDLFQCLAFENVRLHVWKFAILAYSNVSKIYFS